MTHSGHTQTVSFFPVYECVNTLHVKNERLLVTLGRVRCFSRIYKYFTKFYLDLGTKKYTEQTRLLTVK